MIEIFFDFVSPFSYLGCARIGAMGARFGHEVEPRPVLLAGILNALGTKGPAEVPAKRAYMIRQLVRAAHRAGVGLRLPPAHPFNSLLPLRVAALDHERGVRWRIVDALFAAAWLDGGGLEGPARVASVLNRAGLDGQRLVERASAPEAKERLRRNTDEAIARGAFGVPTIFVGDEMFFGFDAFPDLEGFLRGEDPAAREADVIERWSTLRPSATR
jgi:2-hydroxychromene-2-carboxylate isomerase